MRGTQFGWVPRSLFLAVASTLAVGCGSTDGSIDADATINPPPPSTAGPTTQSDSTVGSSTEPPTHHVRQATDFDGEISDDESAAATELVTANTIAHALIVDHGAVLTEWQPAELEGEFRGAYAILELAAPTLMEPGMITSQPVPDHTNPSSPQPPIESADDYLPREQLLSEQLVARYMVAVDLPTMRIIALGPMPDPPAATLSPTLNADVSPVTTVPGG